MESKFEKKLESLLNECSMENGSNTPDFILAKYLQDCLTAFNTALQSRERWYGRGIENKEIVLGMPFDEDLYKKGTGHPPSNLLDTKRTGDAPDVLPSNTSNI